jgi:hypothetical protein
MTNKNCQARGAARKPTQPDGTLASEEQCTFDDVPNANVDLVSY